MIYRDDDANVFTDAYLFKKLHEQFLREGKVHTAAILMKDLWQNHALFHYLATAESLNIGLHGWEHKDYSKMGYSECCDDLIKSLDYWKENSTRMTGQCKEIIIFFAPWNRIGDGIVSACKDVGLKFCNVQKGVWGNEEIQSLHWWNVMKHVDSYTISDLID